MTSVIAVIVQIGAATPLTAEHETIQIPATHRASVRVSLAVVS